MEKIDIFISWHGQRGNAVAAALKEWLPQIVNAFNPWLSSSTDKGSRWRSEVATKLAKAKAGIICLTPSALTAPWLLFEAGAIAKSPDKTYACTLLIDLKTSDVVDPLAQFQHTAATKEELLKLVKTLNFALEGEQMPDAHVERAFEKWWPELEKKLQSLPPDEPTKLPHRDDRELLTELIGLTRQTSLSVLESHRRIIERLEKFESDLVLRSLGTGKLVNLSALAGADGMYGVDLAGGGALFRVPSVPGGTSETLAARTQLRQASQPDEVPPRKLKHVIPRRRKA